jgi:hypothetical protein
MQRTKGIKAFFYLLFEKIIGVSDRWLEKTSYIRGSRLRVFTIRFVSFIGDLGWFLRDIFALTAYVAKGVEWKIVFVGREGSRNEIEALFFRNEEVQWEKIDRVFSWNKNKSIRSWCSQEADLVIYETSRISPLASGIEYKFHTPVVVRQILLLPETTEILLAGRSMITERNMISKSERSGYTYRFSNSLVEFEHFYHQMYVPYVMKRHGNLSMIEPYESMQHKFQRGELIHVIKQGEIAATSLCISANETVYGTEYGKTQFETGENIDISLLIYWYTILWAYSKGAKKVDLGASPAWCSNGIFRNKKRWKPRVTRFDSFHYVWQVYASRLSPQMLGALNGIKFITENERELFRVVLQTGAAELSGEQDKQVLTEAQHSGLSGVLVIGPFSKRMIKTGF